MNRPLVITTEPLPLPGALASGAGLRAWGLCKGLQSVGFDAQIATTFSAKSSPSNAETPSWCHCVNRDELGRVITELKPDVVVMQHWGLMYALPPVECPLVIDLAGPHLLERRFWGSLHPERDLREKLDALARADMVICSGERQRLYFYGFLEQAGFDIRKETIPVIPFSPPPDPLTSEPADSSEITFIYGGLFLPWQDPEKPISWLLEEFERADKGRLLFYGGEHPEWDPSHGKFAPLIARLKTHPRVKLCGTKAFSELINDYASQGNVALDLMARNPERELAFTTRTMIYLYCGLPVIYNDFSEISDLIARTGCGWTLSSDDEARFRALIRDLLENPGQLKPMREKARQAADANNWEKTIDPLAEFCRNPYYRKNKLPTLTQEDRKSSDLNNMISPQTTTVPGDQSFSRTFRKYRSKYLPVGKIIKPLLFPLALLARFYLQSRLRPVELPSRDKLQ